MRPLIASVSATWMAISDGRRVMCALYATQNGQKNIP
jgi:hypothetical protein